MTGPLRSDEERYALVWEAVAELCTSRQALVLRMRHAEGMSYAQIASRLGCAESTVKRDVDRGLRAVGPKLEVNNHDRR